MSHTRLQADQFYWAVLDAAVLPSPGRASDEQLGYLFESVLPLPIDRVQAAYVPMGRQQYLACGMRKDRLQEIANGAITLGPAETPPLITRDVDVARLNLLTGEFEPPAVARLRRAAHLLLIAIVIICSALVTIGLELRSSHLRADTDSIRQARSDVLGQVLAHSDSGPSTQPPELRLLAELRRLRQTRSTPSVDAQTEDAGAHLVALLAAWPQDRGLHAQTEHVSITPVAITVRAVLPNAGNAERFAEQLRALRGWHLQQPQVTGSRESVQASLRFVPKGEQP